MSDEIINLFAEHGLAGLVIAILFSLIFYLIKSLATKDTKFTNHLERSNTQCMKNIQDVLDDDREERIAAREENRKSYSQLSKAIDGLARGLAATPKPGIRKIKKIK